MKVHANAALGPAGRLALVKAIEQGMTQKAAAAAFCVAPATANRWWHRWLGASEAERTSGAWIADRSSRPHRQPRRLNPAEEERILRARRETNLGPGRLAGICRRARSTIWKVLWRHGLSRRRGAERQSYRRYEWSRPGALLHVDMAQLARFERPGHAVTQKQLRGRHLAADHGDRPGPGVARLERVAVLGRNHGAHRVFGGHVGRREPVAGDISSEPVGSGLLERLPALGLPWVAGLKDDDPAFPPGSRDCAVEPNPPAVSHPVAGDLQRGNRP